MVFNSLTFLLFFAVTLSLYRLLSTWRSKKTLLLVASYIFYGAWNPPFVLLLALSTVIDWFAARGMAQSESPKQRRAYLLLSLCSNLGLLSYFKYGNFFLQNWVALCASLGVAFSPAASDIILPVGISFYTFQTLSYTIDVYRGRLKPTATFADFALFVAFFPQLVAGPIVRAVDLLPQFKEEKFIESRRLGWGIFLMTLGLFQKTVLADALLADAADAVFGSHGPTSALDTWVGVSAFAGQIFCDFAGYSTCAIGASLCFGFSLVDNFRAPLAAIGFRNFWRRWHISLSTWLRDYLYIPLGGSRHGAARTTLALVTTMLLGGLWHGASFNFLVWGALHGFYLITERALAPRLGGGWTKAPVAQVGLWGLTFALTCVAWVFFRATTLPRAMMHIAAMMGAIPAPPILKTTDLVKALVTLGSLISIHAAVGHLTLEQLVRKFPPWLVTLFWAFMLFALILTQGGGDAFIYFQF